MTFFYCVLLSYIFLILRIKLAYLEVFWRVIKYLSFEISLVKFGSLKVEKFEEIC